LVEFASTADKGITNSLLLNETSDKGMLKPEKASQEIHPFNFHKTLPKAWPFEISKDEIRWHQYYFCTKSIKQPPGRVLLSYI